MDGESRRRLGAFYTPPEIVAALLDEALTPAVAGCLTADEILELCVLDPACGDGAFLRPAAERLAAALSEFTGDPPDEALRRVVDAGCIRGIDISSDAVKACAEALGSRDAVEEGDALLADGLDESFDVVVGNPPFLSQLDQRTAVSSERRTLLQARYPMDAYTDPAALFLLVAMRALRPGGRMAMVQPLAVLGARDAGAVRDLVDAQGGLTFLWVAGGRVFPDANVQVCAVGSVKGAEQGSVRLAVGGGFRTVADSPRGPLTWPALGAQAMGIPAVELSNERLLSDIATATADFREAFYRLATAAVEGTGEEPSRRIVTTGSIDPAWIGWGRNEVRFAGERYLSPVVPPNASGAELTKWVKERGVPKVIVAGQSRVLEAVMDAAGAYLPATPLISVVPSDAKDLARIAAVLLSPVASAIAATEGFGTALSPLAIKVTAARVRALPLPTLDAPWDQAAAVVDEAHHAERTLERLDLLERAARLMLEAYDLPPDHESYLWWSDRLRSRSRLKRPT